MYRIISENFSAVHELVGVSWRGCFKVARNYEMSGGTMNGMGRWYLSFHSFGRIFVLFHFI